MAHSSDDDKTGFMHSLPGIRQLQHDRVDLYQDKPKNHSTRSKQDLSEDANSAFTATSEFPPNSTRESWFHHGIQKKLQRKIKMGQLTIDALLDLHGFRLQQAQKELETFMQYALQDKARFLLIIHGKGFRSESQAILRPMVQHWLLEQPMVLAYCPAQPADGGHGASYVYLKSYR